MPFTLSFLSRSNLCNYIQSVELEDPGSKSQMKYSQIGQIEDNESCAAIRLEDMTRVEETSPGCGNNHLGGGRERSSSKVARGRKQCQTSNLKNPDGHTPSLDELKIENAGIPML